MGNKIPEGDGNVRQSNGDELTVIKERIDDSKTVSNCDSPNNRSRHQSRVARADELNKALGAGFTIRPRDNADGDDSSLDENQADDGYFTFTGSNKDKRKRKLIEIDDAEMEEEKNTDAVRFIERESEEDIVNSVLIQQKSGTSSTLSVPAMNGEGRMLSIGGESAQTDEVTSTGRASVSKFQLPPESP